jgi:hypothetical protein
MGASSPLRAAAAAALRLFLAATQASLTYLVELRTAVVASMPLAAKVAILYLIEAVLVV